MDELGPWRGARTRKVWPVIVEAAAIIAVVITGTLLLGHLVA